RLIAGCLGLLVAAFAAKADEKLPVLKVGGQVYSNVTVTSFTATDVYFTYPGGIGNAKLKNLSPELQKRFNFNATNATAIEQQQVDATAAFKQNLLKAEAE